MASPGSRPCYRRPGEGEKKKKRERNESHRREGHGAAAGHCPAPPGRLDQVLGARCHPEPPVSPPTPGGTEEAFSPLPASAENKGPVCLHLLRRPQRGHCHHQPPTPGPSAPPASPPPAPSPAWPREPAPTAAGTCRWPSRRRWPSLSGGTQLPPAAIVFLPWETAHGQAVTFRGWSSPRGGERGGSAFLPFPRPTGCAGTLGVPRHPTRGGELGWDLKPTGSCPTTTWLCPERVPRPHRGKGSAPSGTPLVHHPTVEQKRGHCVPGSGLGASHRPPSQLAAAKGGDDPARLLGQPSKRWLRWHPAPRGSAGGVTAGHPSAVARTHPSLHP